MVIDNTRIRDEFEISRDMQRPPLNVSVANIIHDTT